MLFPAKPGRLLARSLLSYQLRSRCENFAWRPARSSKPASISDQLRQFALGEQAQLGPHLHEAAGVPHVQVGPQRQGSHLHWLDMVISFMVEAMD